MGLSDDSPRPRRPFAHRTRFGILILVTLCLSILLSNTLTLNFTVICMADPLPNILIYNQSGLIETDRDGDFYEAVSGSSNLSSYADSVVSRRFAYTPSEKNKLFSAVAVGAMISVYPCMTLIQWFGSRFVMSFFGFFSAIITAFIPLMATMGIWPLILFRALQGVCLGPTFSLIAICTSQWSMTKQNAFFIAFLTCFFQIGPMFTMPVAGYLCTSSIGWRSVYYLHSAVTFGLFILFVGFYREFPREHQMVSDKELERIERTKGSSSARESVPLRAIFTSNGIYAIWITAIANFMGIQITMQFSPIYLNKVMGFPVELTGVFSSIPQVVTFVVKIVAGIISDKATCCRPITSIKIYNSLAIGGSGVFFIAIAYIPPSQPIAGLILLILCTSIIGFNCGAFFKASQLMARQHNHFIMGINSFLNCLATLLAPLIVNLFVENDTHGEWRNVWLVHGVMSIVCNVYFCIFGSADPAPWTETVTQTPDGFSDRKAEKEAEEQVVPSGHAIEQLTSPLLN